MLSNKKCNIIANELSNEDIFWLSENSKNPFILENQLPQRYQGLKVCVISYDGPYKKSLVNLEVETMFTIYEKEAYNVERCKSPGEKVAITLGKKGKNI